MKSQRNSSSYYLTKPFNILPEIEENIRYKVKSHWHRIDQTVQQFQNKLILKDSHS